MTNEEVKKPQQAQPFAPFEIHLAKGRVMHVPHPEFVYVPPINTRTVIVADENGVPEIVNVGRSVSLRPAAGGRGKAKRGRKAG